MSNFGFGFGQFGQDEPGRDPDDLASKIPLFAELQRLLSSSGGPVNWDLARQLAISSLAGQHRKMSAADNAAVADALRLADIWLDGATDLPSGITTTEAWSQIDWVEKTIGTWAALCDPVASRVVTAMSGAIPPEVAAQAGPMAPMMAQLGGMMFGAQLGQGIAALADEVVSATEVGLPLGPAGTGALVLANLDALAEGLERPVADVRLFMALREAAHHRLFSHVPWLRQQLIEAVDAYGRGISIDPEAISAALSDIDPTNPESMQNALTGGLFQPQNTDAQNAALRRLETLLALIEGWVDTVVSQAAGERMSGGQALTEAMRRRRASGGPAEQTFATLVGLELRPRRLREAATLWAAMYQMHGTSTRDGLWNHPDLLPHAEDLDDPLAFAAEHGAGHDMQMPELDDPDLASFRPAAEQADDLTGAPPATGTNAPPVDAPPVDAPPTDAPPTDAPPAGGTDAPATEAADTAEAGSEDRGPAKRPGSSKDSPESDSGESQSDSSGS
jgi:putative hydrolase